MSRILERFKRPDIYSVKPNMLDPNTTVHTHTHFRALYGLYLEHLVGRSLFAALRF
jgi:hypothetical protein